MKTVLTTAASSGIGRATALELDQQGFKVYAAVRKESDRASLHENASANLETVMLDITNSEQIANVRAHLTSALGDKGLDALVNVAGVADFAPIETLSIERFKQIFDVNLFGTLALIQAMLPLLRQSQGRIVNIGSVGAHTTIPFGITICASKYALESVTAGLRIELQRWGIDAIAVDPSSIATAAADKMVDQAKAAIEGMTDEQKQMYAAPLLRMAKSMHQREMAGAPPGEVGKVVAKALLATKPKSRYPVGPNANLVILLSRLLPDRLFDKLKLRMVGIKLDP